MKKRRSTCGNHKTTRENQETCEKRGKTQETEKRFEEGSQKI